MRLGGVALVLIGILGGIWYVYWAPEALVAADQAKRIGLAIPVALTVFGASLAVCGRAPRVPRPNSPETADVVDYVYYGALLLVWIAMMIYVVPLLPS